MSYSIVRLTLYGLLTALETDLRDIIRKQIGGETTIESIVGHELFETLRRRADQDDEGGRADLLEYLDFADSFKLVNSTKSLLDTGVRKTIKDNASNIERLSPIRNRVMHSRPLKFDDTSLVAQAVLSLLRGAALSLPHLAEMELKLRQNPDYALSLEIRPMGRENGGITNNLPIPDFDETGFLGRSLEVTELVKALNGPFPVITVLGEGGIGKTALVLQAAYELVDDEKQPFQAIIWTSSKTTRLTVSDIQRIEGAIESSLGVFRDVQRFLTGQSTASAFDEVLEYLNSFKILLILDNLETVLDQTIKKFLYGLTGSSKVLITSRVGVGELDYTFPLSGMSRGEARQLLRATAQVRRVPILSRTSNLQLEEYCSRMKDNPAFIKWFVTAVQCNRRPDEILAKPDVFLDFCLSNVYAYLDVDSIRIANALLSIPGRHAQPVISYLTELEGDRFQTGLRRLITTNMVVMSALQNEYGAETVYELGDLPRLYLVKNHPPNADEVRSYQKRKREIVWTHQKLLAASKNDAYQVLSMILRTSDDTVAATYLIDALKNVRVEKYAEAFALIDRAKSLAPSYFEVFRVEGWAHAHAGNVPAARASYETAVELEPNSAPLRYWYAGHLLRSADDAEAAREQLLAGLNIDPASPHILAELGRVEMYRGNHEKADAALESAFNSAMATLKVRRISYDGWLKNSLREAESEYDRGEYTSSHQCIRSLVTKYGLVSKDCLDERIIETISSCVPLLKRIEYQLSRSDQNLAVLDTLNNVDQILGQHAIACDDILESENQVEISTLTHGEVYGGRIRTLVDEGKYGFIRVKEGSSIFFHQSSLPAGKVFANLQVGEEVRFVAKRETGGKRMCASDIVVISDRASAHDDTERLGVIQRYGYNGQNFGFIIGEDGQEYFFHRKNIANPVDVAQMLMGTRVRFILGNNEKGTIADSVTPL